MIVGITGGIGTGKSLVTSYLAGTYRFTAVKTDDVAAMLIDSTGPLKENLIKSFGSEIYGTDGKLDRKVYASVIYSDENKRRLSDRLIHPAVWDYVRSFTAAKTTPAKAQNFVVETALPGIEFKQICSKILYIHTEPEIRVARLMKDRGYTKEYALSVMQSQISVDAYQSYADYVVENNSEAADVFRRVDEILITEHVFQRNQP